MGVINCNTQKKGQERTVHDHLVAQNIHIFEGANAKAPLKAF